MAHRFQLRGRTAAEAASLNEVLLDREICVETDTMLYKIGDGATDWNTLPYVQLTGEFATPLLLTAVSNPTPPPEGSLRVYAHDVAGRIVPKYVGPSGLDNPLQNDLGSNCIQLAMPGLTTALSYFGMTALTVVGTMATPNIVTGINLRSSMRHVTVASAATANAAAELRYAIPLCYRGESFGAVDAGGFYLKTRFGATTTTANQRLAVGFWPGLTATATTQNPSALTNCIFAGWDSADTNLQLMHNDGSGTCTKIDLGAGFPANNPDAFYELVLFCRPNGNSVGYRVSRLDTKTEVSDIITTDLPAKTTLLTYHAYMNNGGTAAVAQMSWSRFHFESDY